MKIDRARILGITAIAVVGAMALVGCGEKGAAEKTGAAREKAGTAVKKTGADMQK
jgi:hypothetical protein